MEKAEKIISEIHTGLWRWYDFIPGSSVLYITGEDEVDSIELNIDGIEIKSITLNISCQENWYRLHKETFDYIVSVEILEKQLLPLEILKIWRTLLKPTGCLRTQIEILTALKITVRLMLRKKIFL